MTESVQNVRTGEVKRSGSPHPHRPSIAPLASAASRPLWSVMIPSYNCAPLLARTLRSVLGQDRGPDAMQIEVVDDCSDADDPASVVREIAGDRVGFFRQASNAGHVANFNSCLARARGELIHILHADDEVRDGFYLRMEAIFQSNPDIGAAFCRNIIADESGHWTVISPLLQAHSGVLPNWLETIAAGQRLQAPAMVVRRAVYEALGGFDSRVRRYGEDWEMWVRIAAHYPVYYETEPLAIYRIHSGSLSDWSVRSGDNMRELTRVIEINREVLPEAMRERLSRVARRNHALAALRRSHRLLKAGEPRGALSQLRAAVQSSAAPEVLARGTLVVVHFIWAGLERLRHGRRASRLDASNAGGRGVSSGDSAAV